MALNKPTSIQVIHAGADTVSTEIINIKADVQQAQSDITEITPVYTVVAIAGTLATFSYSAVDTSDGGFSLTMPASPSVGDVVTLLDYAGTWSSNVVTLDRNGSNMFGLAEDHILDIGRLCISLNYIDATQGWVYG